MELLVIFFAILHTIIAEVQQQVFYSIEEEVPIGTSVGNFGIDSRLKDTYPGAYEQLEYSINSQSPLDLFTIDNAAPVLKTLAQIDRDSICANKETCLAEINIRVGPLRYFHLIQVVVEITDLNDNVPSFNAPRVEVSLPESSQIGSRILLQTASDPDSPPNAVRRYALEDPSSTFMIQVLNTSSTDVELYLSVSRELDREVEDQYQLKLLAFDGYGPSAHSGSVLIDVTVQDVNDNNPVFQRSSYEFAMDEPVQRNTLIGIVKAEDGDIGDNAIISYTIQGSVPFRVNSSSGEIYNTNLIDREFQSSYVFTVKASNSGGFSLPGSTKVTVTINDINDNSPVIDIQESTTAEVEENSGSGAYVAHLIVTDADEGANGEFTCALNYNEFKLTKLFGSQYKIITTTSLDRELIPSYNLVIKCEDNGQPRLMSEKSLIVRVLDLNDNAPKFSQLVYLTDLPENSDPGTSVFTAHASDPDSEMNGSVLYSLKNTVDASNFTIDPVSGVIKTRVSFDREQVTRLKVIVVASDQAINTQMSSSATVLVDITDINDETPTFLEPAYTFAVYENQAPGTQVGQVYAVDRDEEPFNDFVFSFVPQDGNDSTSLPFEMDPYSGKVWTTRSLDRETRAEYTLTAFATTVDISGNGDPPYSTAEVHIYIADKNDQPPVLFFPSEYNNTVHVASLPKGEFVTAINASDRDSGTNALLSYFLSGEDSFMFQVDESNGEILTRVDLDKYDQHAFIITVVVRDHGDPPMSAQSTMTIVVNSTIPYVPMARQSSRQNLTIVIVIVCLSSFAMIILLTGIAIVWVMHRRASKRHKMSVLRGRLIIAQREAKEIDSISDLEVRTPEHQLQTQQQTHEGGNLGMFKIRKKSGNKEGTAQSSPKPPRVPEKTDKQKAISQNSRGPDADLLDCCSSGGNSENSDVTDSGRGSCDDGTIQSRHPLLQSPKKKPAPLRRAVSDAPCAPSIPPRPNSLSKADMNQSASSHHSNSHSLPRTPQRTFTNQDLPEPIYPTPGGTVYSTPSPVNPKLLKILQSTPKGNYKVDSNLTEHGSYV